MYSSFKYFAFLFLWTLSFSAFSQSGNSPYSRIGLGEVSLQGTIHNNAMGGIGVSNASTAHVNLLNPALLTYNRSTVFEAAYNFEYKVLQNATDRQSATFGNIGYFAFAFPVTKRWTTGVGLLPYSTVNYSNVAEERIPNSPAFIDYSYKGSGGMTQVYFSNGVRFFESLSLGLRINYNFGAIRNQSLSHVDEGSNTYSIELLDRTTFGDFSFESGIAWQQKLGEKMRLNVGATYAWTQDVNFQQFRALQKRRFASDIIVYSDTLTNNQRGSVRLPENYKFGLSLSKEGKFTVGADVAMAKWSQFERFNTREPLSNTIRYSVGAEWTPESNPSPGDGIFKVASYRLGFSTAQLPMVVEGIQLSEQSVSFGGAFPLRITSPFERGIVNLAVTLGQRGTTDQNLIRENFVRVSLGATINNIWFIKRRLD